jgi:hypothetical protein
MDEQTKQLVASILTAAFYSGTERREPYLGDERRAIPYSTKDDNRVPSLSVDEVYFVYSRFWDKLDEKHRK